MKLTMNHYDYLHLAICAALLFAQLATSLDISTLPTVANTHKSQVELPVRSAEFSHRVLINDHYHLNCPPVNQFIVDGVAKEKSTADVESSENTKVDDLSCPIISQPPDGDSPPFVYRAEVDVGFADDQQLRLLQRQTIKWEAVGGNLSLMALYRENPRTLEACFLTSGLFEVGVAIGRKALKSPTPTPLVICRSAAEPFRLGLHSMWHKGGLCTFLELPDDDDQKYPKSNWTRSLRTYLDEPIELAVRQQQDLNYSWAEVPFLNLSSGHWTAPPSAVEVEIGRSHRFQVGSDGGFSKDFRPLYIARLTVNASFTTVIGLFGGVKLPLEANENSKLELLVEDEAHFQVELRLSSHLNPKNVFAEQWNETLFCRLQNAGSLQSASLAAVGEVKLVDIKVDSSGPAMVAFGVGREEQVKPTSWKIFRKSLITKPYWGPSHGGSLFSDDALFIGKSGTGFSLNELNRLPRHLCRTMLDHWYAGYLDHSSTRCIVPGNAPNNDKYQLLYSGANQQMTTTNNSSGQLVWAPYRHYHRAQMGAIIFGYNDYEGQIFFARLKRFTNGNNQTAFWLYGSIVSNENTFYYTDNDKVAREVKGAKAACLQVLALN